MHPASQVVTKEVRRHWVKHVHLMMVIGDGGGHHGSGGYHVGDGHALMVILHIESNVLPGRV